MDTKKTRFYFLFIDNSEYKPYSATRAVFLITNTNLNKRFLEQLLYLKKYRT